MPWIFDGFDYDDVEEEEESKPTEWLYIKEDIIATKQSDGSWWVENGHWEGHINDDGYFVCNMNGSVNKTKPIFFADEKGEMKGNYNDYMHIAYKKFFSSIRSILQNETDSWLGGVLR